MTTLLEASHDHLLVTPPSHFAPQKVRGWFDGFIGLRRETTAINILLTSWVVKGNIASSKYPPFNIDFSLKYCILRQEPKNKTSGRSRYAKKPNSSPKRKVGSQFLLTITFLPGKVIG